MKKIMLIAAAAAGLAAMADGVSSGIVGYTTITLPAGQQYTMCALPFDSVSDPDGISIQELFPDPLAAGLTGATMAANADQIMFWYNGAYSSLFLFSNTSVTARHNKWINPGASRIPDASWGTGNMPSTLKIKGGTAFWIKRKNFDSALTLTVAGSVITAANGQKSHVITAGPSYTLIAGSFSAPFAPNPDLAKKEDGVTPYGEAVDWLAMGCHGATMAANADQLMFWRNGAYSSLFLFSNASVAARHNKWINPGASRIPDASWGSGNMPSTMKCEPGEGFWYKRADGQPSFEFIDKQPYTLAD